MSLLEAAALVLAVFHDVVEYIQRTLEVSCD